MELRSSRSLSNVLLRPGTFVKVFYQQRYTATHVATYTGIALALNGTLVAVGLLQTVLYLLFIRAIDLYEREPLRYVVPVFIWGFAVATTISLIFNTLASITLSSVVSQQATNVITSIFVAPVVEECSKGL